MEKEGTTSKEEKGKKTATEKFKHENKDKVGTTEKQITTKKIKHQGGKDETPNKKRDTKKQEEELESFLKQLGMQQGTSKQSAYIEEDTLSLTQQKQKAQKALRKEKLLPAAMTATSTKSALKHPKGKTVAAEKRIQ